MSEFGNKCLVSITLALDNKLQETPRSGLERITWPNGDSLTEAIRSFLAIFWWSYLQHVSAKFAS
jgi:hypothetical protein